MLLVGVGGIFGQGRGGFEGDDGVLKRVALGEEGRLSLVLSGGRKGLITPFGRVDESRRLATWI